jgi:hypothetical protein
VARKVDAYGFCQLLVLKNLERLSPQVKQVQHDGPRFMF